MMEAAWSTLSSNDAATAMLAWAAGTIRITADAARARIRLFVGICAQSEAIDGPVYFGIFTSISADLGPAAPFDAIAKKRGGREENRGRRPSTRASRSAPSQIRDTPGVHRAVRG